MEKMLEAGVEIKVKNAEGDPDTKATIIHQNSIDYEPKVSVIIPVYNTEEYLRECLDSVVNQTLKEIEIICVDDGSTDSSLEILKEYAQKDNRFTIITQKNLHAGVARNAGLAVARGEYLSFLDSDDWFELNMLEEMYRQILNNNADITICGYKVYDSISKKDLFGCNIPQKYTLKAFAPKEFQNELFDISTPVAWSKLYKHSFVNKINLYFESLKSTNDLTFTDLALCFASKVVITPLNLIHYRTNSNSNISSNRGNKINNFIKAIKKVKYILSKKDKFKLFKESYYKQLVACASWELKFCNEENYYNEIKETVTNLLPKNYKKIFLDKIQPKVSVVIPVYNVEKYLRECLNSVINQTLKDIEIICINDGSTDNSLDILNQYKQTDKRIKVFSQENKGLGAARNIGARLAKGKYLLFVDSDDWLDKNCLDKLYNKAEITESDICIYGLNHFDDIQKMVIEDSYLDNSCHKNVIDKICTYNDIKEHIFKRFGAFFKFYNRDFFINYIAYEESVYYEDVIPHIKSLILAKRISFCNENLYFYRAKRAGSIMSEIKDTKKTTDVFNFLIGVREFLIKENVYQKLEKEYYNFIAEQLIFHYKRQSYNTKLFIELTQDFLANIDKNRMPDAIRTKLNHTIFPAVSVIIPVYNTEKYLRMCLDSVLNQTLNNIEVICINDGSTDNSWQILQEYASKDNRIILINQDNKGQGAARNAAIKIAKGEYIQFVDSDDWLELDALEKLYNKANENNLEMLQFTCHNYYPEKNEFKQLDCQKINYTKEIKSLYTKEEVATFFSMIPVSCCLNFYSTSFIKKNNIAFPEKLYYEDNIFFYKALLNVERFSILDEILYNRTKRNEQTTNNWERHFSDYLKIIKILSDILINEGEKKCYQELINNHLKGCIWRLSTFAKSNQVRFLYELYSLILELSKKIELTTEVKNFLKNSVPNKVYREHLFNWYKKRTGKTLILNNPKTYNEKMQWLKLYNSTPIKTQLADKFLVRDWVKKRIGEEYLVPVYGIYDDFDKIDFDKLPNQFVIKYNHGCSFHFIVKDKNDFDLPKAREKFNRWKEMNFAFECGCELHYSNIKPKIIIEEYIDPSFSNREIQAWVFNNKIKFVSIETIKDAKELSRGTFYPDGKPTDFQVSPNSYKPMYKISSEKAFKKVIELSKKMLVNVPYVRIDFIEYGDTVKFREMTFTSGSGLSDIQPAEYNNVLGSWIKLPKKAYNIDTGEYYKLPNYKLKRFLQNIFSIKNEPIRQQHKIITILGLKLKIRKKDYGVNSFVENIFSVKNEHIRKQHKIITILGLKIKIKRKQAGGYSFAEKIFSVKNRESRDNKWYKVICIFGVKFKFRNKELTQRRQLQAIEQRINQVCNSQEHQFKQMSNKFNSTTQNIDKQIKETNSNIKNSIQGLNSALEQSNANMNNSIQNLNSLLESSNSSTSNAIQALENKIEQVNENLQESILRTEKLIAELNTKTSNSFKNIEEKFDKNLLELLKIIEAQREESAINANLTYQIKDNNQNLNKIIEEQKNRIFKLQSELGYINEWQQNFYKSMPQKYPIRLSEVEKKVIQDNINNSKMYLEFGSGGTTFLAVNSKKTKIVSIESDSNWIDYLISYNAISEAVKEKRLEIKHINIGKTKEWGYPVNDDLKENYPRYSSEIFEKVEKDKIDLVLIDGRFRVACALATIMNCKKSTKIMIHDYTFRQYYHILEEFLDIVETIDTLVVFKIKNNVDMKKVEELYNEYKYVKE